MDVYRCARRCSRGRYTGTIEVNSVEQSATLHVHVNVQNQVLPRPQNGNTGSNCGRIRGGSSLEYYVEPWGEAHKTLLKKHLKIYADAGGTYITTYAVHSPWSENPDMIEGGMIDWLRRNNGNWKFDYKIFDEYVELAMEWVSTGQLHLYSCAMGTPVPVKDERQEIMRMRSGRQLRTIQKCMEGIP